MTDSTPQTTSHTPDQTAVRTFLLNPASYPNRTTTVTPFETHGAVVYVTDSKAYKLKKAVAFPYMDYGTLARRAEMCAREIVFNRRTAPDIYLRAVPVTTDAGGNMTIGGTDAVTGTVVEWLVEMNRFDPADVLAEQATRSTLDSALILRLTDRVADFHEAAEPVASDTGGYAALKGVALGNDGQFAASAEVLPRALTEQLTVRTLAALAAQAGRLDARAGAGKVRRCHGDLHLGNVCVYRGEPLLFDCIEFNDAFAVIDTLYDFAFLRMDLDARNLQAFAGAATAHYMARTGEHADAAALLPVLCSLRAAIRAHVSVAIGQGIGDAGARAEWFATAGRYLHQALSYFEETEDGAAPAAATQSHARA
jgi:uncharacterized protein